MGLGFRQKMEAFSIYELPWVSKKERYVLDEIRKVVGTGQYSFLDCSTGLFPL